MQELQPQLSELLRTCVHPPSLLLKVAHIDFVEFKHDLPENTSLDSLDHEARPHADNRHATKFLLTDGHLMIQALLHRKLSTLQDATHVQVDDLLDIRRFNVKKSPRSNGRGRVIYLAIEDCTFLLKPRPPTHPQADEQIWKTAGKRKRSSEQDASSQNRDVHALDEIRENQPEKKKPRLNQPDLELVTKHNLLSKPAQSERPRDRVYAEPSHHSQEQRSILNLDRTSEQAELDHGDNTENELRGNGKPKAKSLNQTFGARVMLPTDEDEADEFFEAIKVDRAIVGRRRQAIAEIDNKKWNMAAKHQGLLQSYINLDVEELSRSATASKHDSRTELIPVENEELQLPPAPASKRDGTFALSQLPAPGYACQQPKVPAINIQPPTQLTFLPPPPFHTLHSLRNPPADHPLPSKSYTITTLAIISWTGGSLIHRPGSPFPPKRHLKIVDPSLSSSRPPSRENGARPRGSTFRAQTAFQDSVTVAVYLDAATFQPIPGTIALFQGLVMQRLANGDIILNVYARLKDQRFEQSPATVATTGANTQPALTNGAKQVNHDGMAHTRRNTRVTEQQAEAGTSDSDASGTKQHWFITNHEKIRAMGYGSKLDYYLEWWNEKQQGNANRNA